jgi:(p)ppGpp synthase/HD superfamily hydrolase
MKNLIKIARQWVKKHDEGGQTRWGGEPYSSHPIAVADIAMNVLQEDMIRIFYNVDQEFRDKVFIISLLHDIWEDRKYTKVTMEELIESFGEDIVKSIVEVSKQEGEEYYDFILRISKSKDIFAIVVKMADLQHNLMDIKRGSMKDKYRFALHFLRSNL